jgi:hypothetical protein
MAKKTVDENGFTMAGEMDPIKIAYGNFRCIVLILLFCGMEIELKGANTKCRILVVVH